MKTTLILTHFTPIQMGPMIPQEDILDYTAWLMAMAQVADKQVTSPEKSNQIFEETLNRIEHYGVSPKIIKANIIP